MNARDGKLTRNAPPKFLSSVIVPPSRALYIRQKLMKVGDERKCQWMKNGKGGGEALFRCHGGGDFSREYEVGDDNERKTR